MSVWPPPPEQQHQPSQRTPTSPRLGYWALASSGAAVLLFIGQFLFRGTPFEVRVLVAVLALAGLGLGLIARRSWAGRLALVVPTLLFCRFLYFLILWYQAPRP